MYQMNNLVLLLHLFYFKILAKLSPDADELVANSSDFDFNSVELFI